MVFEDPSETTEVLATPEQTGDRYQVRLTVPPGGGPGIRGFGVHLHPGLIETFRCVSGAMIYRSGRTIDTLPPGEHTTVPAGVVHGFKNTGKTPLVVDVDMVFTPPGPRPEADLMAIGLKISELAQTGRIKSRTGYPSILDMATIMSERPQAIKYPGPIGLVMPALAYLGHLLRHKPGGDGGP